MRTVLRWTSVLCVCICRLALAAEAVAEKSPPMLTCQEQLVDFGILQNKGEMSHVFTLMNAGEATLDVTITKPDTSKCRCRPSTVYSTNVEWGCELDVLAAQPLKGRKGPLQYQVTVDSNDPENPTLLLTMKADVRPLVDVVPEVMEFHKVPLSEVVTNTCALKLMPDAKVKIRKVKSDNPYITARLRPTSLANTFDVQAITKPPLPPGPLEANITVRTSSKDMPELSIPVHVEAVGPIEGLPEAIPLFRDQTQQTQVAYVRSKYVDFYITSITFPEPGMGAAITNIDENTYRVTITNMSPAVFTDGQGIKIKTSYEQQPELFIPVALIDEP